MVRLGIALHISWSIDTYTPIMHIGIAFCGSHIQQLSGEDANVITGGLRQMINSTCPLNDIYDMPPHSQSQPQE